jgi:hypothetical protein
VATIKGPITVSWKLKDNTTLEVKCTAPENVKISFVKNGSHDRRTVLFNGNKVD